MQLEINCCSASSSLVDSDEEYQEMNHVHMELPSMVGLITVVDLINLIDVKDDSSLIIDIRGNRFYQMQHIKFAINFSCSTKLMSRRSIVKWTKCYSTRPYNSIIIYDDVQNLHLFPMKFINHIQTNNEHVQILSGGFSEFVTVVDSNYLEKKMTTKKILEYTTSPTRRECSSEDVMKTTMSEIIPKFLYLGNELDAKDKHALKGKKITDIMNVTSQVSFFYENLFNYYRIPASDSDKQNLSQYFDEAFQIIESVRNRKGRIFIHCWAGVSRSSTIVMMYLMKTKNMDVLEALKYVQERRPIADPNLNFLGQLSVMSTRQE